MDIKLIKAEIEKLSLMLSSWDSEQEVSAIERDIALDKLKTIYDLVRFDSASAPVTPTAVPPVVEEAAEPEMEEDEKDVEVELIFAEDDEMFTTLPDIAADEDEEPSDSASSLASEILASAMAAPIVAELTADEKAEEPAEAEPEVEPVIEPEVEIEVEPIPAEPAEEPAPVEAAPAAEIAPEPVVEIIPEPAAEVAPEPVAEEPQPADEPVEEKPTKREEPRTLNSLFGFEEVQRRPRTKHQRMMSIYNDSEPRPDKVVDISKIFDMDVDTPKPITSKAPEPKPAPRPAPAPVEEERTMTIADAMAATTQTLADTLVTPAALGDEMNHSKIRSLREGIGLNDKFLMIRDLFDGDDEAYDEAISELDTMETMDDCMIHIIENYAWNPDTEGSKFIMQLLERKLS